MGDCEECGGEQSYPRDDYNKDCTSCRAYFEDEIEDYCPFQAEIYENDEVCRCTEAQRYDCIMSI